VKRVRADATSVVFQIAPREREALLEILQTYPVVPPAHQNVSRTKDARAAECQRLLDEALAEQRAANKNHLQAWLATPGRFKETKSGYRFTLDRSDGDWLLQVLNDIRVGHWLRLGSPELGELKPENLDANLLPAWIAMELSGYFQMSILEALAAA
jgi:hypothetical protein